MISGPRRLIFTIEHSWGSTMSDVLDALAVSQKRTAAAVDRLFAHPDEETGVARSATIHGYAQGNMSGTMSVCNCEKFPDTIVVE